MDGLYDLKAVKANYNTLYRYLGWQETFSVLSQLEGLRSKLVKEQTLHQQNSELRAEIDSLRILTSAPQAEKKKEKKKEHYTAQQHPAKRSE